MSGTRFPFSDPPKPEKNPAAILLTLLVLSIPATFVNAWALSLMWKWFMVPLHLPALSMAHTYGIALLVAAVTHRASSKSPESPADAAGGIASAVFQVLFLLGIAYIVKSFM